MWDGRGTDERTNGQTDGWSETNIPPNNFVVRRVKHEHGYVLQTLEL